MGWFQPFKRRNDRSVGVMYFIVAGIVPEMSKEPKSMNTFLAPIVDELKAFWIGVKLKNS